MIAELEHTSVVEIEAPPGEGPPCNREPYEQMFVVRAGRAAFYVDRRLVEAGPGEVVLVPRDTRHAFRNIGEEGLRMTCISPGEGAPPPD
jgi:mannose-6-phosphate isomerase-like protein (cupin superfamily)